MYALLGTDTSRGAGPGEKKPLPLIDQLSKQRVAEQCDTLNFRHKNAQMCGRRSTALHTYLYFQRVGVQEVDATVTKMERTKGPDGSSSAREFVWLSIPRFGIEERVRVGQCVEESGWYCVEHKKELVLRRKGGDGEERRVFDTVRVRIEANDRLFRNQTTLTIV